MPQTVRAIVNNRMTYFPNWPESAPRLDAYFAYRQPNWQHTQAAADGWDGYVSLLQRERVGTGLFEHVRPALETEGYVFDVTDRRRWIRMWDAGECQLNNREPYEWQKRAVEFIRENGNVGCIVVAPTGTGKTTMVAWAFARLVGRGIFVVDERALGQQTQSALSALLNEPVGFVGDGQFTLARITVATVQTLADHIGDPRFEPLYGASLMVVDEMHVMLNKRMKEVGWSYGALAVVGLTATLDLTTTSTAFPAFALTGSQVFTYLAQEAREAGQLAQGWAYLLDLPALVDGSEHISRVYKEYVVSHGWLNQFMASLAMQAVQAGYTVVVLVQEHDHIAYIAQELDALGASYLVYSGKQSGKRRIQMRNMLNSGTARIAIATTGTMTKGIDIPNLNFLMDGSQSAKWENSVQRAGRGSRVAGGKDHFVYVDIGQTGVKVRGVTKRNLFALRAKKRREGLKAVGYEMRRRILANTNDPVTEAASVLNYILEDH